MILIGIALLFLVIGGWEHGRKLSIALFIGFLGLGLLELSQREPDQAPLQVTFDSPWMRNRRP